ncbi:hypothetical protein E2562_028545 [Oryza meyeriana var. granulata]|uniref:Uncharacterized protein n=1 Tax=Oryza meyeriana var. granulata TaxID=110450 RepID=A0A6G1EQR1_9ORYZ|nr:hypothetical protein E2562_028545 [Oryza meyeriana var. granulata]
MRPSSRPPAPHVEESPASLQPAQQDALALPEELDDLLLNFWDATSEQQQQQQVAFNSSCILQEKTSSTATATTTNANSNSFCESVAQAFFTDIV